MSAPSKFTFRYDINGLRAWAVLAVVLYHFNVAGFANGFTGVDIFFVISGYLMTRIIVEGIEASESGQGTFSVLGFYFARAKRIIPALACLGLVVLLVGWAVLDIDEFRGLGTEIFFALIFLSNYKYWFSGKELGGYFEAQETPRWLLHSWSLSVEWQFYLILPILIVVLWKLKPGRAFLTRVLGAVAVLSLAASIFETHRDAELAFFSLHTRAWEMLAGGMVFLLKTRFPKPVKWALGIELIGFLLILLAIFIPQPQTQWPGYRALLPVVGAAAVLWADRQQSIWTNTPAAQYLGKISYSLYLWHWPVVVALKYASVLHSGRWVFWGLILTFILSVLSFHFVEKAARNRIGGRSFRTGLAAVALIAGLPALTGMGVRLADGVGVRGESSQTQAILEARLNYDPRREECLQLGEVPSPECHFGSGTLGAILIGDSHAMSAAHALRSVLPSQQKYVLSLISSGCPIVRDVERTDTDLNFNCTKFVDWALGKISAIDADVPVIVMTRTSYYLFGPNEEDKKAGKPVVRIGVSKSSSQNQLLEQFRKSQIRALCELSSQHTTYVVLPVPEMGVDVPSALWRRKRLGINEQDISISWRAYQRRHEYTLSILNEARESCDIQLLDPAPHLCSDGRCWGSEDGYPLYFDDDHLNLRGEAKLAPMFEQIWSGRSQVTSP